jgi:alkanesulfonate monooxygenase SsuD/methylene tetrahydromethanopterin reductase-like flavin-dependent oxidoreductase (luciferase family)
MMTVRRRSTSPSALWISTTLLTLSVDFVAVWTACGSVDQVVEHLRMYRDLGFHEVTLCPTAWDQLGQLTRVIDEVIPRLN